MIVHNDVYQTVEKLQVTKVNFQYTFDDTRPKCARTIMCHKLTHIYLHTCFLLAGPECLNPNLHLCNTPDGQVNLIKRISTEACQLL